MRQCGLSAKAYVLSRYHKTEQCPPAPCSFLLSLGESLPEKCTQRPHGRQKAHLDLERLRKIGKLIRPLYNFYSFLVR
jgi:hypothetical protein